MLGCCYVVGPCVEMLDTTELENTRENTAPRRRHHVKVVGEIMYGIEHLGQDLLRHIQMAEIGA